MLDLETCSINSRRPSVDTISTYLSNGSKGSRGGSVRGKPSYGSVSDLLNCSLSSENDEVFLSSHSSLSSSMSMNMIIKGSIVGIDSSSEQISRFVSVVDPPQSQPCPICLNELHRDNSAKNPTVSLSRCQHLMHLNCLNELILSQKSDLQKVRVGCKISEPVFKCSFDLSELLHWMSDMWYHLRRKAGEPATGNNELDNHSEVTAWSRRLQYDSDYLQVRTDEWWSTIDTFS